MDFSESKSKKAGLAPNIDVQTDDFVTLQDSNEFLVQGASDMFGMDANKNSADKHDMKMIAHLPSSSDPQFMPSQAH